MWRHRYSNQWIWHVQWTGTPEPLNIRRGSALTKWWRKKKLNPTTTSPSLFIGTQTLKGLASGASAHSSSARKIRRAYPTFFFFFFSLFLFSPTLPRFFFLLLFLHLRVEAALFCWRRGGRMGPSHAGQLFGGEKRAEWAARDARTDASWSSIERQWLNMLSGIQDAAASLLYCAEMCELPRDMDLGNYLPAWYVCSCIFICLFCAQFNASNA